MSLKGLFEAGSTDGSFSGFFHMLLVVAVAVDRHFPGPLPLLPEVHADFPICSNMVYLACCMRRAASVSLIDAATRFSAAMLSPGRRNCCGRSSESSFSSGVRHSL
jgi:hypothetical protein